MPFNQPDQIKRIQTILQQLNLYQGPLDGISNPPLKQAIRAFQLNHQLLVDGIVGPQTWGALERAAQAPVGAPNPSLALMQTHNDASWKRVEAFLHAMEGVTYGPGRGLFLPKVGANDPDTAWVINWAGKTPRPVRYPIRSGKTCGPSLHCNSLTNFLGGYMMNLNALYTNSGNGVNNQDVCTHPAGLHKNPVPSKKMADFYGYGDFVMRLVPDGDTASRKKIFPSRYASPFTVLDIQEIWARRTELSMVNLCDQSDSKFQFHHAMALIYNRKNDTLIRVAADGSPKPYSAAPITIETIDQAYVDAKNHYVCHVFRLLPGDDTGKYGVGRPEFPIRQMR